MADTISKMHSWSHLVLFIMLFLLALAVMNVNAPTGLAAGNQSITAQSVTDLSPFLTAVGLLIAVGIVVAIVLNSRLGYSKKHHSIPKKRK